MTKFFYEKSAFQIKPTVGSKTICFGLDARLPHTIQLSHFRQGTGPLIPYCIPFRNRSQDNIRRHAIIVAINDAISLPTPLGTTTKGIKAKDPAGNVWYLQVT